MKHKRKLLSVHLELQGFKSTFLKLNLDYEHCEPEKLKKKRNSSIFRFGLITKVNFDFATFFNEKLFEYSAADVTINKNMYRHIETCRLWEVT